VEELTLTPQQAAELAALHEDAYSAWLTDFYDTLDVRESAKQTLILQAIPGEAPQVIAAIEDSDGDEEATHFRSPWPAMNEALVEGRLSQPISVSGRYNQFHYSHHLVPFDATQRRILLVNEMFPSRGFTQIHFLAVFLSVLLSIGLWASR
jgi:hypothetical protein